MQQVEELENAEQSKLSVTEKQQILQKIQKLQKDSEIIQKSTTKLQDKGKSTTIINTTNNLQQEETQSAPYGHFYRKSISQQPSKKKSILKKQIQELKDTKIKVFYFGTDRSLLYNYQQLQYEMSVGSFIQFAIQNYCSFYFNFSPSNIQTATFVLRLDDTTDIDDFILDPIDHEDKISSYTCSTLYLTRVQLQTEVVQKFQKTLTEFIIFDIAVPKLHTQKRHQKLTIQRKQGILFEHLVGRTFKTLDITQNPKDFLLVQYHQFIFYNKNQPIENVKERKFQLLKSKKKTYHDKITIKHKVEPEHMVSEVKADNWLLKNTYPTQQITNKQLSVEIDLGFLRGTMIFSLQNCQFVETYQRNMISSLIERIYDYEFEVRRSLLALKDAYQAGQYLVLEFVSKQQTIIKRYPMSLQLRMNFLEEILRLCRIYKKGIQRKDRPL